MKNRTFEPQPKNGKLFCWHYWKVVGNVGLDWDLIVGLKLPARCTKCGRSAKVSTYFIDEVSDGQLDARITYLHP